MTKILLDKMRTAIKDNKFFDFIANNYYQMDKEDLKQIIMEMDWFIYTENSRIQREAEQYVLEALEDEYLNED